MTCQRCHCRECTREKVNERLRVFLAEHEDRIAAAHQWDADEARKAELAVKR